MKRLSFFYLAIILFISCNRKQVDVENPVVSTWKVYPGISDYNKIVLNMVAINDSLIVVANNCNITYINPKNELAYSTVYINLNNPYNTGLLKPGLSKDLTVSYLDKDHLVFIPTIGATYMAGIDPLYTPKYSSKDSMYKGLPLPSLLYSTYPTIKGKYFVIPYEVDQINSTINNSLLTLNNNQGRINIEKDEKLEIKYTKKELLYTDGICFSTSFYDKFFISYFNLFYRIDTLGNTKVFGKSPVGDSNEVYQMFKLDNSLFALGGYNIYISSDQGETWS